MVTVELVMDNLRYAIKHLYANEPTATIRKERLAICERLLQDGYTELPVKYRKAWKLGEFKNKQDMQFVQLTLF